MKRLTWRSTCVLLALALFAAPMFAAPVYGTDATGELIGSRSEGTPGIVTADNWVGDGASIEWTIIDLGGGQWSYTYNFIGWDQPEISHFILDLTDDCVEEQIAGCVVGLSGELDSYGPHPSNPNFPVGFGIVGIKFDGNGPFTFTSDRDPVWGDFYIKGGNESAAWNSGLTDHSSENILDFIARPNGGELPLVVPEPATYLAMGIGLVGLTFLRRFRR